MAAWACGFPLVTRCTRPTFHPIPDTGIGNWTEADFIARFKAYAGARIPVSESGFQTQHAWSEYARLSEADLAAIYAYLMAQPPVRNAVSPTG